MNIEKLRKSVRGEVVTDEDVLEDVSSDFGRLFFHSPRVVVVPANDDDVRRTIEYANGEGYTVATRGAAHSQSGQSLSREGVLLDMQGLKRIGPVEGESVWVDSGVVWAELVEELLPRGLVPPVLTNNLNVTVGGTLSIAGLGVASHRFGTQADNVEALEVVTGSGDHVTCSSSENPNLFNCVRCGLGQFGVITRAKLKLRRLAPFVRTYYLLYDDLNALIDDQTMLLREQRFDFVEGWCTPCVQGLRAFGGTRVPFAEWFFPVHLTVEHGGGSVPDSILQGLHFYRRVHTEDSSMIDFVQRMEPVFQLWRETGSWKMSHPWMEVTLPWEGAVDYIGGVLASFPPNLMMGGHILLWPCRGTVSEAPMFLHPKGEFVMGFGILPAVQRHNLGMALSLLRKASDLAIQVGGKRYLSGWVDFDHDQWKAHFGQIWPQLLEWKRFFDPNQVLNPGFIHYQPPSEPQ